MRWSSATGNNNGFLVGDGDTGEAKSGIPHPGFCCFNEIAQSIVFNFQNPLVPAMEGSGVHVEVSNPGSLNAMSFTILAWARLESIIGDSTLANNQPVVSSFSFEVNGLDFSPRGYSLRCRYIDRQTCICREKSSVSLWRKQLKDGAQNRAMNRSTGPTSCVWEFVAAVDSTELVSPSCSQIGSANLCTVSSGVSGELGEWYFLGARFVSSGTESYQLSSINRKIE